MFDRYSAGRLRTNQRLDEEAALPPPGVLGSPATVRLWRPSVKKETKEARPGATVRENLPDTYVVYTSSPQQCRTRSGLRRKQAPLQKPSFPARLGGGTTIAKQSGKSFRRRQMAAWTKAPWSPSSQKFRTRWRGAPSPGGKDEKHR